MASAADTRTTALLLLVFFLLLVLFLHGHRGLLELATRENMVLLCHAILLLILRDAGLLAAGAQQGDACSPAAAPCTPLARPHATRRAVVWRRPRRKSPAPVAEAEAAWAAPALLRLRADEPVAVAATQQIVVVVEEEEEEHRDVDRDRAAIVPLAEQPAATAAADAAGDRGCFDRRVVAVAVPEHVTNTDAAARGQTTPEMGLLADDRTFEEFIRKQRREMRQESLRLLRSGSGSGCQQPIAAC